MTEKLETANRVLATFAKSTRIERRKGGWFVCWKNSLGIKMTRRWSTAHGSSFYPTWYNRWSRGGTSVTALAQLIRWLQNRPTLPICTWEMWAGDNYKLVPNDAIQLLRSGGYPEKATCVLCHKIIEGGFDWWSLNGVSGPCCGWTNGCKQKGESNG